MNEMKMAFVAAKPCGCVVALWGDTPSLDGADVVDWFRSGLTVTYVPVAEAKWHDCPLSGTPEHDEADALPGTPVREEEE